MSTKVPVIYWVQFCEPSRIPIQYSRKTQTLICSFVRYHYSPVRLKFNRTFSSIYQELLKVSKHAVYHLKALWNCCQKWKKNLKFSTFVSFLGQFLKKWCFVTLKPVKIFEWNFQQSFLIEIHEKWIHNGWACPPFRACHAHFSKTLIFQKWP